MNIWFGNRATLRAWKHNLCKPYIGGWYNQWRPGYRCFDGSFMVLWLTIGLTIWQMPGARDHSEDMDGL